MPVNAKTEYCENVHAIEGGAAVEIIDQTLLPNSLTYVTLRTLDECYDAIARLQVRGAPAIGIFAGYAFAALAHRAPDDSFAAFKTYMSHVHDRLVSARPTAVNLAWALDRMMGIVDAQSKENAIAICCALDEEAQMIQREDVAMCHSISEYGLSLLKDGMGIITHCNAGPLATSRYGTGLGPLLLGTERGMHFKVFSDETRPLLQGARLTTYELEKAGVDVTLICDNMASLVMDRMSIGACLVGCDRVAANGDVANKIGTSGLAIIAAHYHVPLYVMCPSSTIDMTCASGADIPIELRNGDEIKTMFYNAPTAPDAVPCYNPSFDITDHSLVSAIVTERGICRPPYSESLRGLAEKK
jgi:methylthioribose-1-phosphate isomerase